MKKRVIFGALFAAIALAMILAGRISRIAFFVICGACMCWEMRSALGKCGYRIPAWFAYSVFLLCSGLVVSNHIGYAYPVFMTLIVAVFGQMILIGNIGVKDLIASFGMVCYPLSFGMTCMYVAGSDTLWAPELLNTVLPAIMCDTFALLGGRRFGKHKLSPHISPNKTVEGFISGIIVGTLSGFAVHFVLKAFDLNLIPLWAEMVAALLASLSGALGDLAASAIKREAGIKDYSNLIPGHGGMLDRVDSSVFAMPVVYMLYALFI